MKIENRIITNPMSKGKLGKTIVLEALTNWINGYEIPWSGSDLDDRHNTFSGRHPEEVRTYKLGNELEAKNELLKIFRAIIKAKHPMHIIDTRAQADELIMSAIDELEFFLRCEEEKMKMTFLLFPTDDNESMKNLTSIIEKSAESVDYVVCLNPSINKSEMYLGSKLQSTLLQLGAKEIVIPAITPITLMALEKAENHEQRGISFAEAASGGVKGFDRMLAGELSQWLQKLSLQFDSMASLLLPDDLAKKVKPAAQVEEKKKKKLDLSLNIAD